MLIFFFFCHFRHICHFCQIAIFTKMFLSLFLPNFPFLPYSQLSTPDNSSRTQTRREEVGELCRKVAELKTIAHNNQSLEAFASCSFFFFCHFRHVCQFCQIAILTKMVLWPFCLIFYFCHIRSFLLYICQTGLKLGARRWTNWRAR